MQGNIAKIVFHIIAIKKERYRGIKMGVRQLQVNDALVLMDDSVENRWYGLNGNGQGFDLPIVSPLDDTTADPTEWIYTPTEAGTGSTLYTNAVTGSGDKALVTNAANEYDGINMQLKGEAFTITTDKPFYFGCKMKISDATQSDLFIGLAEADTTLLNASTSHAIALGGDGLFFVKLDGSTTVAAKTYLDGAQTGTGDSETVITTGYHIYEIYYNGSEVVFSMDGSEVTRVTASLPDGAMTPSLNFRNGEAVVKTATIQWLRAFQVN